MRKALLILCLCSVLVAQDKPYRVLNSFNAGELSPLLSAREDLSKFHSGCSVMENMIPLPQGAAQKRPGTVYVAESKNNTKIRLLPFAYSTEQSYIIELGNQYARFYTDGAQITSSTGENTSSYPQQSSLKAHWKLNETSGTTVEDSQGSHDGSISQSVDASELTAIGEVLYSFDFSSAHYINVTDHADFSFVDTAFSIAAWAYVTDSSGDQFIISKDMTNSKREWWLKLNSTEKIHLAVYDETNDKESKLVSDDALDVGAWYYIVATYDGREGADAADGLTLYVDGSVADTTATNDAGYVKMVDDTSKVNIADEYGSAHSEIWKDRLDNIAVWKGAELTSAEVTTLYGLQTGTETYEITTPYLTADLFELQIEQSADVLYITHPDYESRKLSRRGNTHWTLDAYDAQTGPFRGQNTDETKTITPSAVTGSITLTASGCSPFEEGITAGHLPSGSAATSKSQTGALFRLVHPLDTLEYSETLSDNYTDSQVENTSWMDCGTVYKDSTWYLTTLGIWTGTLEVQRNYTIGAAHGASGWEKVFAFASTDDRNVTTNSTEDDAAASYRAILTESGDAAEPCAVYFRTNQTEHDGIVEITAVASTTSATATVLTTLGSTNATHKWSEGAWSNYRGWPRTVTFFEDRLVFGGNASQPDTIWASVTSDYENMLEGPDDDDALLFTLSSRQVNVIEWMVGKNKLLIGTSGAEWTLEGSSDEPLTPSNVQALQHSAHGSANLQATLASESVLFFQRGSEKMRELAYNWEEDSFVAPDMTILVPEITGDGITDTAYQQTPNSILWCVRDDGEMAIFVYERKELITSWSRLITDGLFESVAVINGDPEDEVWVSVNRTIGGDTVRYIEYFSARDFGSDVDDAFFVDSGITYDSDATTTIPGLTHLAAETVAVLGDGAVQTSKTVSGSGTITITSASTVQAGLPFTVQMRTMPLSMITQGGSILGRVSRINKVIPQYYNSGDFYIGRDATTKELLDISGMDTSDTDTDTDDRITFPAGYDRFGYVFIYQQSPEPLTLISLNIEFMVF